MRGDAGRVRVGVEDIGNPVSQRDRAEAVEVNPIGELRRIIAGVPAVEDNEIGMARLHLADQPEETRLVSASLRCVLRSGTDRRQEPDDCDAMLFGEIEEFFHIRCVDGVATQQATSDAEEQSGAARD